MNKIALPFSTKNSIQHYYKFSEDRQVLIKTQQANEAAIWAIRFPNSEDYRLYAFYQYIDWREGYPWAAYISDLIRILKAKSIDYKLEDSKGCDVSPDNWFLSAYLILTIADIEQL